MTRDRSAAAVARAWCKRRYDDFDEGMVMECAALVRAVRRECRKEAVADLTGSGVIRTQYARQMVLARLAALNRAPRRGR